MNELNCCKELNIEYEFRQQDTSGKLCYINLPGSFAGFESFFRSLKERGVVVQEDKRRARDWMKGNSTYTKHRYARRRFPTNKVIVNGIDDTLQMDLVDMCSYSISNNGYNWILVLFVLMFKQICLD